MYDMQGKQVPATISSKWKSDQPKIVQDGNTEFCGYLAPFEFLNREKALTAAFNTFKNRGPLGDV